MTDPRIAAIRADKAVGSGTCSSIDECYEDKELMEVLNKNGISTPEAAVAWAREIEEIYLDQALNARWGDDNDPQLEWKRDFEARCKEN